MQVDYIREKAKKLGLDPGTSSNHEDNLRTIAKQLGLDYDLLPSLNILDKLLDEMLIEQGLDEVEELLDIPVDVDEILEQETSEDEESSETENTDDSQQEKNTEEKETADKNTESKGSEENTNTQESKSGENTNNSQGKGNNQQKESSTPKQDKSDKPQSNLRNKFQSQKDALKNKTDALKNKAKNFRNPGEALKGKTKNVVKDGASKVGSKVATAGKKAGKAVSAGAKKAGAAVAKGAKTVGSFIAGGVKAIAGAIASNPYAAAIVIAVIVVIIILLLIIFLFMAYSSTNSDISIGYYDTTCDFNLTTVSYTDCADGTIQNLDLSDFVKGNVYAQIKDKEFNEEEIMAMMIISKTNALINGNYDNNTKNLTIDGCSMEYLNYNESPIDLNSYYENVEGLLYLPASISGTITSFTISAMDFNVDKFNYDDTNYEEILNTLYNNLGYKIYNLADNCTYYNVTENDAFWWPIGSNEETSANIHGGTPSTISISSKYGYRTVNGKGGFHHGIDISGGSCVPDTGTSNNVIIASKNGKVIDSHNGCPSYGSFGSSCGGGYGNYVILDHGDGTKTVYAHLMNDTIVVSNGDTVEQGQKLGLMGSSGSSTGCHLHFEVRVNNSRVNPLDYVSTENPRPVSSVKIKGVENATGNKNEVCQTLLNSGFSENATIGLMININEESGFDPNNVGDNGTSYGLCQWHNGRWTKLKTKKPNSWQTIAGQLEYLLYELQNVDDYAISYKYITGNYSAREISTQFCLNFEVPANRNTVCPARADNNLSSMTAYVQNGCKEGS